MDLAALKKSFADPEVEWRPVPYRCEIRSLLYPGQNTIALKITNSMQNFLEGKAKPSGLLGCVFLY